MNLSVSNLKFQGSALSVFLDISLACLLLSQRLFKTVSRKRPPPQRIFSSWYLGIVLDGLLRVLFEPLESCTMKHLTLKVILLVAVVSARRVSELYALSTISPYCTFFPDRIVLQPDPAFLLKVALAFHRSQDIVIPSLAGDASNTNSFQLNARKCLITYLERTRVWRKSPGLFLIFEGNKKGEKPPKD